MMDAVATNLKNSKNLTIEKVCTRQQDDPGTGAGNRVRGSGRGALCCEVLEEGTGKDISEKIGVPSEETSEKILGMIRAKTVSARQLAKVLGLRPRAVEHQVAQLRKKGFLKRIGPDKGGHWEVSGD